MPENSFSKQKLDLLCRRSFLGSSGLGILGLSFPQCLSAAATASKNVKAKNVLVIYEQGGLSHMDTWDSKPEAISE